MIRRLQIPAREMVESLRVRYLLPKLGIASLYLDYPRLLEAILDGYFYDTHPHLKVHPLDVLLEFGLPTDLASRALNELEHQLLSTIQSGFVIVWPGRTYTYRITEMCDVVVTEDSED